MAFRRRATTRGRARPRATARRSTTRRPARRSSARSGGGTSRVVVQLVAGPGMSAPSIPHGFAAAPAPRTRKF